MGAYMTCIHNPESRKETENHTFNCRCTSKTCSLHVQYINKQSQKHLGLDMKFTYDLKSEYLKVKYFTVREWLIVIIILAIVCVIAIMAILVCFSMRYKSDDPNKSTDVIIEKEEYTEIEEYYNMRKNVSFSKLGQVLFMNAKYEQRSENFKILIWKEGPFLERRHIRYYKTARNNPFDQCSVNNCNITYEDGDLESADAVVFPLKRLNGVNSLPKASRNPNQRWIFLTDESPWNTFANTIINDWRNYSGVFNWSMSYKIESDIPVPYGRTILKHQLDNTSMNDNMIIPNHDSKRRDVLLATQINDCPSDRVRTLYMEELKKYLEIDVYGECGQDLKTACSRSVSSDCKPLNNYLFYLAFENSNCEQYTTDNLYWNAYSKGAIPIIMGPTVENCQMLLPPNSYLHTENYKRPEDLANYLLQLNRTWSNEIFSFHEWRKNFKILNEHGYHGTRSFHYCRICEALNYNNAQNKVYEDLSFYLNPVENCRNLVL
ncbi:alpha-(1,3)-fucosyltransferase 7-like [Arctopsyche grandis]|uniref:alpha-(1,3)-fucosyltransferase 7-like n=1 Tax=Arctopsyche grandis TaxID=121162 RepID=UPI00406D8D7A